MLEGGVAGKGEGGADGGAPVARLASPARPSHRPPSPLPGDPAWDPELDG